MKTMVCSVAGVAGLAVSAGAQVNWETRIGFAQSATGPLLQGNSLTLTATGTYTFYVRVGMFNMTGFGSGESNQGLFDWTATANATGLGAGETLGINQSNARISPFTFGPATSFAGTLGVDGSTITSIDAARDVSGGATANWDWDTVLNLPPPMPTAPNDSRYGNFAPRGIDSYTNVWRFTVMVSSLGGADIVVSIDGQAGPILRWVVLGTLPPDEEGRGFVNFLGLTAQPSLHDYSLVALTLVRVPSPGGIVILLFGGAAMARRRRRKGPSPPSERASA